MAARITPYRNGPYLVRGDFVLAGQDGEPIEVRRRTIALCRCGKSRTRPFCDGTHKSIGFKAEGYAEGGPTTVAPSGSASDSRSASSELAERGSLDPP